jgi:hypothetical protein
MNGHSQPEILATLKCGIIGCKESQNHFGFCSEKHFALSQQRGLLAPSDPNIDAIFVGPTGDFSVILLRKNHPEYISTKEKFLSRWIKPEIESGGLPMVRRIFQIRNPPTQYSAFKFTAQTIGNVRDLFHGTSQSFECNFGRNKCPPCGDENCRICNICKQSFSMARVGENTAAVVTRGVLRYGPGLYFSSVSGKSNDYSKSSEKVVFDGWKNSRWRSMFLCKVALGNSFVTEEGRLPGLPAGYDSVKGEVGKVLNYDEAVVYDEVQAIPSFLIIYSLPLIPLV